MDEEESTTAHVAVQHCLLVKTGTPDESWQIQGATENRPYVLRGVSYRYRVAPDVEFPTVAKPPWAIYLRVLGWNAGPTRVLFCVHYRNQSGQWEHLDRREMDRSISLPEVGEDTRDVVLNLPYLRFGGVGLHAVTAHFWYDGVELDKNDQVRGNSESEIPEYEMLPDVVFHAPDWAFGAVEYFLIERQS